MFWNRNKEEQSVQKELKSPSKSLKEQLAPLYSLNSDSHIALSTSANLAEHESRLRSRSMETS